MPKLTFRGVKVRGFDGRIKEGGAFCRVHLSADYSDTVMNEMEWGEMPDWQSSAKIKGEGIRGIDNFTLAPNSRDLKQYEITGKATDITDFQIFRVKAEKDSESTKVELRFILRTDDPEMEARFGMWNHNYSGVGQLKVNYPVQTELDLAPAEGLEGAADEETKRGRRKQTE